MAEKRKGVSEKGKQLQKDLENHTLQAAYVVYGKETYQKQVVIDKLKKSIEAEFADFNLVQFEGKDLTPDSLTEALYSCPIMGDTKLVIVRDLDLYRPPAGFTNDLPEILAHIPSGVTLVFYYDSIEWIKPDKETNTLKKNKLHKAMEKLTCAAEFDLYPDDELIRSIQTWAKKAGASISSKNAAYLLFVSGHTLAILKSEVEKAAAYASGKEIDKNCIDAVCSRELEAIIFDLTDALMAGQFPKAVALVGDLFAQKVEMPLFSASINRQIQRLYAVKLCETAHRDRATLMKLIKSNSQYYADRLQGAARRVSLAWLRRAASIAAEMDSSLKSTGGDKQRQIEMAILRMASEGKGA